MKKTIHLISIVFILFSFKTFSQENSTFKMDVGGKSILIPVPENNFTEVGTEKRKLMEILIPKQNKLLAFFLPTDISLKYGIEPVSVTKMILIEVEKTIEYRECSEKDFIDFRKSLTTTFSNDLPEVTKNANQLLSKLKDVLGNVEIHKPVILGTILDIKDAYAYLMLVSTNMDQGLEKTLEGVLFIRVKNKILFIYISSNYKDEESLTWVSNTTQTWSKLLVDLNK